MNTVFDGHLFQFYQWDRDVKEILAEVYIFIETEREKVGEFARRERER